MAGKKPGTNASGEIVLFDVIYEDGTQLSNRRVPAGMLGGLDKDEPAIAHIEAEDRRIGVAPSETYLAKAATPAEREQMAGFLQGFPHRYLVTHTPEQVYTHYQLSLPLTEKRASVDVNRRGSLYEVIVLTLDRPFLFASLCAGLSSFGLNIEKAEAFANAQGHAPKPSLTACTAPARCRRRPAGASPPGVSGTRTSASRSPSADSRC